MNSGEYKGIQRKCVGAEAAGNYLLLTVVDHDLCLQLQLTVDQSYCNCYNIIVSSTVEELMRVWEAATAAGNLLPVDS